MICDWLANRECLFPGEFSVKIDVFRVRCEKRSDIHTKDKRQRKRSLQELKPLQQKSHSPKN